MSGPYIVLALRALGLGDVVTAIPALRALQRAYPDHRRLLATPAANAPLLRLSAVSFEVVDCPRLETPAVSSPVEVAVNLHGRGPESRRALLALSPRRLIAFRHPLAGGDGPLWDHLEHEMSRWCRLLVESGIPADPADYRIDAPSPGVAHDAHGATILHPGAKDLARRWPSERWAVVAREQAQRGHRVLITGSADERELAGAIAARAGLDESAVLAGKTDLVGLAALLASAGMLICGDTGVAHLGSALGTPSVLLFGPTHPSAWGPPPSGPHRVLWKGQVGDPHATSPHPGLLEIDPDEVIDAIESLRLLRV